MKDSEIYEYVGKVLEPVNKLEKETAMKIIGGAYYVLLSSIINDETISNGIEKAMNNINDIHQKLLFYQIVDPLKEKK